MISEPGVRPLSTTERLRGEPATDRLVGWVATLTVTAVAFVLRLVHLGDPNKLVFDEVYYAKDAYSLLQSGYERRWRTGADKEILKGNVDQLLPDPSFIVHPQLGKWLIAAGEHFFGMNSFGWRVAPLIAGTLLVFLTIRLTRRVARSTLIGCLAGVLLTFDGLAFVMSRTALLDIFVATFTLAAVACLVADRDWFRGRLADHLVATGRSDLAGRYGPLVLFRPWRLAAGVCFGLALGSKWNALYFLAAFALLALAWDVGARRLAGAGRRSIRGILGDGLPAFGYLVIVSGLVYLATWASWLASSGGYDRSWGADHPGSRLVRLLGDPLASLAWYHRDIWNFHHGSYIMNAEHAYRANPIGWLVIARPLSIHAANSLPPGSPGCAGPENCLSVITAIGTPALWWAAIPALIAAVVLWIGTRDWRFGIPVVGVAAGWLPWFQYESRPLFFMYAIVIIPFSVMALALCAGRILGPARATNARMIGGIVVGAFVALVAANFAYLYPILTNVVLPYHRWLARMWLRTWI